jgi:hypothetical protein
MGTLDQTAHGFPPAKTIAAAWFWEEQEPESKQMAKKRYDVKKQGRKSRWGIFPGQDGPLP